MPPVSERQRRFMGAELGRLRRGEKTSTGMSEEQLRDFARKKKGKGLRRHAKKRRRKRGRLRRSVRRA